MGVRSWEFESWKIMIVLLTLYRSFGEEGKSFIFFWNLNLLQAPEKNKRPDCQYKALEVKAGTLTLKMPLRFAFN